MGANKVLDGGPITPTTVLPGTDGNADFARVYTFDPPVSLCLIGVHDIGVAPSLGRINGSGDGELGVGTNGLTIVLPDEGTYDVSFGGQLLVHTVEIVTGGGADLDKLYVHGWR